MNSAAMKFIPKSQMEAAGYKDYLWVVDWSAAVKNPLVFKVLAQ
jgi:hypothetical protein